MAFFEDTHEEKVNNSLWVEKYRPRKLTEYVGNEHLKEKVADYLETSDVPHLLFFGKAGTGKTTLAKLIVNSIECDHIVINASDENNVDTVRNKVKNFASSMGFKKWKIIILDEFDYMTPNAQAILRNLMETFSQHCRFILTCNFKNRIIDPLHSRCSIYEFNIGNKAVMAEAFMKRLQFILDSEHIIYDNAVIAELIMKYIPDWRRVINECQRYGMSGHIDTGILVTLSESSIAGLMDDLKTKNFKKMRKWVTDNIDVESAKLFRLIYDNMSDYIEPSSIPQLVLILADYSYKDSFVADHELNVVACMTEIMSSINFK